MTDATTPILTPAERLCPHCGVYPANGEWCPKCAGVFGPSAHRRADVYAVLLRYIIQRYEDEYGLWCVHCQRIIKPMLGHDDDCIIRTSKRALAADDAEIARMLDTLDGAT